MSSSRGSRPSTPSRFHTYHSSFSGSRVNLSTPSTRSHLPAPKVLPFPDLTVRPGGMSREHSRGPSPLASPGPNSLATSPSHTSPLGQAHTSNNSSTSSRTSYADALAMPVSATSTTSSSSHASTSSNGDVATDMASAPSARLAHSVSPTTTPPPGLTTPRPSRPRAATTSATPVPSSSTASVVPTPRRQEGFYPGASTISLALPTTVMAEPATMSNPPSTTHNAFVSPPPILNSTPSQPPTSILLSRPTPVKKPSLPPPNPLPSSLPVSPPPPQQSLNDHLFRSLKTGACADVRIWVRRWNVGWLVHKMVLVQAGEYHRCLEEVR